MSMAASPTKMFSSIFKEYVMMDGDVARESNPNDDFDIIGDDAQCSTSGGGGPVVSVEADTIEISNDPSVSKQPVEEEFSITATKEEEATPQSGPEEEELIANGRIDDGVVEEDKAKASAEELMEEFGISLDSGVKEESDDIATDLSSGDVIEEEQVASTTTKSEEAGVTLDILEKESMGDNGNGEIANISLDTDLKSREDEDAPGDIQQGIPEDTLKDTSEDVPKDTLEPDDDTLHDSAVDVTLDTSQDTSLDISQDISLDVSLDKFQDAPEENNVPETTEQEIAPAKEGDKEGEESAQDQDPSFNSEEGSGSEKENEGYRPGLMRSKSSRLDSSKFSKFETSPNTSAQSSDGESAGKRHTFTGRLNMARFSQFEQNAESTDGGSAPRIRRNVGTRSKSLKFSSTTVTSEMCHVCQKRVYPMEKITADSIIYHKTCFRCAACNKCLNVGKFAACQGNVFCIPHFKQNFKLKGNYDFTNNPVSPRQTNGVSDLGDNTDSININRSFEDSLLDDSVRLMESPISPTRNESVESAPPRIVRSSDVPEEAMSVEGGTHSVKSRFEHGDVTSPTSTSLKSVNIYDAPAERGVAESTPVRREDVVHSSEAAEEVKVTAGGIGKFKNMFEKGGVTNLEEQPKKEPVSIGSLSDYDSTNQGHVAESTPILRADVVRSSDSFDDPGIQRGFSRSLKSRFETERISNIEEKPKQKIEISSPEERRVYQPEERAAREDIVNAQSQLEDPGIKSGQARSLRSLFEKGNVSNIVDKPRPGLERPPRSLEEFSTQDHGSESTPIMKENVASSSTPVDEPMKSSESARSLKQRWETGRVEHAPTQPKPTLERTPGSLDNYSMTMVISENTPQERSDIVKSSAPSDDYLSSRGSSATSLKAKWESGEIHTADAHAQKADSTPNRLSAAYYDTEEPTNGVVDHENGLEDEDDESEDASYEIKAARALALAEMEDE